MLEDPDFVISTFKDSALVVRCITEIRIWYPEAQIIVVADGDSDESLVRCTGNYEAAYIQCPQRLKLPEFGGEWLQRMFEITLLLGKSRHVILTEGKCRFWRQFHYFPEHDLAGSLQQSAKIPYVRSGCTYLSQAAMKTIVESGQLHNLAYVNSPTFSYSRHGKWRYAGEPVESGSAPLCDLMLGHAAQALAIVPGQWNEVDVLFRGNPWSNEDRKFAATHPHPSL